MNIHRLKTTLRRKLFLLSSRKKQLYLIDKNACLAIGYTNMKNYFSNQGDVRTAMYLSDKTFKYLSRFAMYCDAANINEIEQFKMYLY